MKGINQVFLLGRVGQPPELKILSTGKAVCTFSVATHRFVRDGEDFKEETDWIDVKVWDRQAEIAEQFIRKGDPVAIQGRLRTEAWVNADGQHRSRQYVYGRDLTLLPSGTRTEAPEAGADDQADGF